MIFLYILFSVYILAVNFYGIRYAKALRDGDEGGDSRAGDGKLVLTAILGGAVSIYASLLAMRYRLNSMTLMIFLPVIAVLNVYCFFLGFRSIYLFI